MIFTFLVITDSYNDCSQYKIIAVSGVPVNGGSLGVAAGSGILTEFVG